ncbi:hypothetical protein SLEP1_g49455 [Rubroshorea leprosula]|uniref:Uncharacterized protein n=1 Tax=Rubroshorea leprosula TaxID=152421 RepID=A0AAV5LWV8_9ROSI|nr:hypothetical protein SLEP1_g49455 [Rubroshorea leprosula]
MSGGPINSAQSRPTSGRRGRYDAVDLARDVTPVMNAGHTQSISPQGSIHGDNMKDERDKWRTNGEYRLVWVPEHLWPTLCTYWDSDEFHILSERGKKNRASGEQVSHTTRSVSFDVHEEWMTKAAGGIRPAHQDLYKETHTLRKGFPQGQEAPWCGDKHKDHHDTYVSECSTTYGSDSASWLPRDNDAWVVAVGECHSNFMPGIGSHVNPEELGAYGMRPPSATPSLPHTGQAFLPVGTAFPIARPLFHASGPSFPHAMPMQLPIEPAFPMGQMGRQSEAPNTSSPNPPQDEPSPCPASILHASRTILSHLHVLCNSLLHFLLLRTCCTIIASSGAHASRAIHVRAACCESEIFGQPPS